MSAIFLYSMPIFATDCQYLRPASDTQTIHDLWTWPIRSLGRCRSNYELDAPEISK